MNDNPPCSKWSVWLGPEIEGLNQIGTRTLFVRKGDVIESLARAADMGYGQIKRIWLCKEYLMSHAREDLLTLMGRIQSRNIMTSVAVEVPAHRFHEYDYLRPFVRFYIKLDIRGVERGDHVCVGPAFNDEAFALSQGLGNKVTPDQYLNDVFIE